MLVHGAMWPGHAVLRPKLPGCTCGLACVCDSCLDAGPSDGI